MGLIVTNTLHVATETKPPHRNSIVDVNDAGASGYSGYSGYNGYSGYSGYSGASGSGQDKTGQELLTSINQESDKLLMNEGAKKSLDWYSGQTYNTNQTLSIDWQNSVLYKEKVLTSTVWDITGNYMAGDIVIFYSGCWILHQNRQYKDAWIAGSYNIGDVVFDSTDSDRYYVCKTDSFISMTEPHLDLSNWTNIGFTGDPHYDFGATGWTTYSSSPFLPVGTVDWQNNILSDSAGMGSIDWQIRTLIDGTGQLAASWGTRILVDSNDNTSLDWGVGVLTDTSGSGSESIDWFNRILYDNGGSKMLGWSGSQKLGFFSTAANAPVVQQNVDNTMGDATTIANILTALKNYGLITTTA